MKMILFVSFCLNASMSFGQLAVRHPMLRSQQPDSLDIAYYSDKKKYLQAGIQVFGLNMGLWAFDRYLLKGDYAYINLHTVKDNFRKGFIWDNDNMGTNMFFHPYHGSLYFNSARSSGFNFWQSGLYAIGGSAM